MNQGNGQIPNFFQAFQNLFCSLPTGSFGGSNELRGLQLELLKAHRDAVTSYVDILDKVIETLASECSGAAESEDQAAAKPEKVTID